MDEVCAHIIRLVMLIHVAVVTVPPVRGQGVMPEGCIFHLPFDGSLAAAVAGGDGRPRIAPDPPQFTQGVRGQALFFGGPESAVTFAAAGNVAASGTVAFWLQCPHVHVAGCSSIFRPLLTIRDAGQATINLNASMGSFNAWNYIGTVDRPQLFRADAHAVDGKWRHWVITWDADEVRFYLDGVRYPAVGGFFGGVRLDLAEGGRIHVGPWWEGEQGKQGLGVDDSAIDELRCFNRVLGDEEIKDLHQRDAAQIPPTTAASRLADVAEALRLDGVPVVAVAVQTPTPPTIDGALDDPVWQRAVALGSFRQQCLGGAASEPTSLRLLWDREHLYVGVRCELAEDEPSKKAGGAVEVYLSPPDSRHLARQSSVTRYYRFRVTAAGESTSHVGMGIDAWWEPPWSARTRRGAGFWETELAIPLASLDSRIDTGAIWRVNFTRQHRRGRPSGWSLTRFSPHESRRFGEVLFVADGLQTPSQRVQAGLAAQLDAAGRQVEGQRRLTDQIRTAKSQIEDMAAPAARNIVRSVTERADAAALRARALATGASDEDGLAVFATPAHSSDRAMPFTLPREAEAAGTLRAFAAGGEYEPITFAIYALHDLEAVDVRIVDLTPPAPAGVANPAPDFDVRTVKCWFQSYAGIKSLTFPEGRVLRSELLLKDDDLVRVHLEQRKNLLRVAAPASPQVRHVDISEQAAPIPRDSIHHPNHLVPFDLPRGQLKEIWLTAHVPPGTPPGLWRATVQVAPANAPARHVPLELEVLAFDLPPNRFVNGLYHTAVLQPDHGPRHWGRIVTEGELQAEFENLARHGFINPVMTQTVGSGLAGRVMRMRAAAGLDMQNLFTFGTVSGQPKTGATLAAMREEVRGDVAYLKACGARQVFVMVEDEPSHDMKLSIPNLEAVHSVGAGNWLAIHEVWRIYDVVPWIDVIVQTGPARADLVELAARHGAKILTYANPHAGNEDYTLYRHNYGLGLWKTGAAGSMDWAYMSGWGDPWVDHDQKRRDQMHVYPVRDGVIDTVQWEAMREAVDDQRYLTLLEHKIALTEIEAELSVQQQARDAESWLEGLRTQTDLQAIRREMAEWISRLSNDR